jgi:hypothetical protein
MRSGSITPRTKEAILEVKDISVSCDVCENFYYDWVTVTQEEIEQIDKPFTALSQSSMLVLSADIQSIKNADKYFKKISIETSGKVSEILQTRKDESTKQLELVRKFLKEWIFFKKNQSGDENYVFEDFYSILEEKNFLVKRYGINVKSSLEIEEYNQIMKTFFDKSDSSDLASSKKSSKKSADKAIEDNKKLLHPVEVFVLEQALAVLQQAEASKVVLLDIFERKTDGTINMQDKLAKTHTLVLCDKGDKQFELIDPSNSDFSIHLVSNCNRKFFASLGIDIVVHKNIKLYIPASSNNVGSEYNQFRDCIDIAAKVAFVILNNVHLLSKQSSVYEMKEIQELSNQREVDEMYPDFPQNVQYPLRVKQSSSNNDRNDCHEVLCKINVAKTLATQKLPYEIELNWEEMQSIDDHKKTLMWLKEKQEKITSFIMDREEQNKINEILSVRGLKFKS